MKETPIIFTHNIDRLRDGRKTMTRRVMSPQPEYRDLGGGHSTWIWDAPDGEKVLVRIIWEPLVSRCPYGYIGDLLWVKESWRRYGSNKDGSECIYKADSQSKHWSWKNPMFMPRWASRISLSVEDVEVQRIQSISPYDCLEEGIDLQKHKCGCDTCQTQSHLCPATASSILLEFRELWDKINAARGHGWEANPWVWAIKFKCIKGSNHADAAARPNCRNIAHRQG